MNGYYNVKKSKSGAWYVIHKKNHQDPGKHVRKFATEKAANDWVTRQSFPWHKR